MTNKYLEKLASVAGFVAGAKRMAGSAALAAKGYAAEIPGDAGRLATNLKNIKTIKNVSGVGGVAKTLATNKAVQTGAGLLGTGYLAGRAMKRDDK